MAKSLEKITIIKPGTYKGLWSAYYVKIMFDNGRFSQPIKLNDGVRGINIKCEIIVDDDGWVNVE